MSGILYIVATPIGNLEDMTTRGVRILNEVSLIACEDTRHTKPLLSHFGISTKMISFFEYSKSNKVEHLLNILENGNDIALVSDAGIPTLSDPGARLISQARLRGYEIIPIPGANAFLSAVSVSGFSTQPLTFWGFLPPSNSKRKKIYEKIKEFEGTHCFYESKHKILKRSQEWKDYFGGLHMMIAKEITKKHETYWWGETISVVDQLQNADLRGEFTVLVSHQLIL